MIPAAFFGGGVVVGFACGVLGVVVFVTRQPSMIRRVRAAWRRWRYAHCSVCGTEFRKGQGSGVSRRTVCSDPCWTQAWYDFFKGAP